MSVLETERLALREATLDDAAFFLRLLNEPAWKEFIGDSKVRTLEGAARYIQRGLMASYAKNGFGLLVVEEKEAPGPIGICGLINRSTLDDVDLGFAFLSDHCGKGYATESGAAVRDYAWKTIGLPRLAAVTSPENAASIHVLEKLGFRFVKKWRAPEEDQESNLYLIEAPAGGVG